MSETCVFILDDEIDIVEELAECLEQAGIHCLTETDPMAAKQVLAANDKITVLVTDVKMPEVNGIDLAREIVATRKPDQAIEVVVHTGWANEEGIQQAALTSGFTLLQKPPRRAALLEAVKQAEERALAKRSMAKISI